VERAVQVFAAVSFLVIGAAHVARPGAWIEFFAKLRALGRAGAYAEGFLCLSFGAIIVSFHHVWTWPAVLLTVIGWAQVVKSCVRFLAPEASLRLYAKVDPGRAWQFRVAGLAGIAISVFLAMLALRGAGT
jgi:hypothetical protein